MKRALITGASGQDGYFLSRLLLEKGYEVHLQSRSLPASDAGGRSQPGRRGHFEDQPEVALVDPGDVRQAFDITHAEPPAAQFGNRCRAQGFEDDLDLAQQVDRRAGG